MANSGTQETESMELVAKRKRYKSKFAPQSVSSARPPLLPLVSSLRRLVLAGR